MKRSQAVELGERLHGAPKQVLKLKTNEQWNDWYKNVQLATITHKKVHHFAKGCTFQLYFSMAANQRGRWMMGLLIKLPKKNSTE